MKTIAWILFIFAQYIFFSYIKKTYSFNAIYTVFSISFHKIPIAVFDIMHWNCLAWQQSTSSDHTFFHPKPPDCPNQIDTIQARNNPRNACLCVLQSALLSANRVSPLKKNPVPIDTPPNEMKSSPLHLGKPVTSRHCLAFKGRSALMGLLLFSADVNGSF